ncbi:MAG: JAB domain-containing protein [Acidobacteriota bacterium]
MSSTRAVDRSREAAARDCQLLASLLGPAVGGERAETLAAKLLDGVDLLQVAKEDADFFEHLGVERAAISTLTAAFELSARLAEARIADCPALESAEEVARFIVQRYRIRDQEVCGALYLDQGGRMISAQELFKGSGRACTADPKVIMRRALLLSASSLILFHGHPGGNTTPSLHDVEFTKRVAKAGKLMDVRLLDHLVLAPDGQFTSMRRERLW